MRVTHVITGLKTGGAEILLARMLEGLSNETPGSVISLTDRGVLADRIEAAGHRVVALELGSVPGPLSIWKLRRALVADRPDVIQSWLLHGNVLTSIAGVRVAPIVWGVHMSEAAAGTHGGPTVALQRLERAISARSPAGIIACSASAEAEMRTRGYAPGLIETVANGFDTEALRADPAAATEVRDQFGLEPDALLVGHFARFHPMKDHANLLAAAAIVEQRVPAARFLLCGDDVERSNPAFARASSSVLTLGRRSDVPRLMQALDVCVLSSASGEALPLVLGEAMATGVPCVATDVGDSARLIGDTGRIVPPSNPEALADALVEILTLTPSARGELGAAARKRIEASYSLERMLAGYEDAWQRVTTQARTA